MNQQGKAKADALRKQMKRYKQGQRAAKVADLQSKKGSEAVSARAELRRMRDVWYATDPSPSATGYFLKEGAKPARGSTGKAKKALSGWKAKQQQGMNIGRA